jgi:DNA-binding response OmpR family regulator
MKLLGSVLVADDEDAFRASTCRLLKRAGLDCHTASNGEEAINALQAQPYDALIADIQMPRNPELRVVREARNIDSHMGVILVTGYPTIDTAIRSVELSVAAYLTKPVDGDELFGHVQTTIANCRKQRTVSSVHERLQTCISDLERMDSRAAKGPDQAPLATIRTLATCLSELLCLSAHSAGGKRLPNLCELLDCPRQEQHREAILETIDVLKTTKSSFKSKALANLRAKLELVIGAEH